MKKEKILPIIKSCNSVTLGSSVELYGSPSPGLPLLIVDSAVCYAVISLQGAQLLEFKTADGHELLWLSSRAEFEKGKPIRGGIPICAPWFGNHATDEKKPKHGFVRCNDWELKSAQVLSNGDNQIEFLYRTNKAITDLYGYVFQISLTMTLGSRIRLRFQVENLDAGKLSFNWALHSYFSVSDLNAVQVTGLTGVDYLDKTNNCVVITQENTVSFDGEVDRVYQKVGEEQNILGSGINIRGLNCPTAIIWNPGVILASKINDIGADGYLHFICVERGAAFDDAWQIDAGCSQVAELEIYRCF